MEFKRLTSSDGKTYDESIYEEAMQLYATSFPKHEQREEVSQKAIMSDADYHFECIYDGDIRVGIMLYWEAESFIYIEHLCIFHDKRNPFPHLHPAYHAGNEPHRLIIMSYPAILKQEEYDSFKKYLDTRVMGQ